MSTDSKKIAKNVVFVYTRIILITAIGLLSTRFALQALGQSDYGLYGVVGGVVAILAIVCTAMSTTTRRFINIEAGKTDGNLNKVFNTCLMVNISLAVFLFILAETLGLFYIYNYLNIEEDQLSSALYVFNISTAVACMSIIFTPYLSLLEAHENFGRIAFVDILVNLIKLLLIYGLLYIDDNHLICYAIIMATITFSRVLLFAFYCHRSWPDIIKYRLIKDKQLYKEIAIFNGYITLGAATYVTRNQGSNMLVNFFFGTVVNGAMSIAYAVESYVMLIISNLTTASAPQITKSYSSGKLSDSVILASRINKYSIMFMSALVFIGYVELPTYLKIWLGEIPTGCLILCQCTLISALVRSLFEGLPPLIQATGKIKWIQLAGSITQLIVLPLGWCLFKFGFPPQSIIISFICTTLINFCLTLLIAVRLIGHAEIAFFIKQSILPNMLLIAIYILYIVLNKQFFPEINCWLNIFLSISIAAILIIRLGMSKTERVTFVNILRLKLNLHS